MNKITEGFLQAIKLVADEKKVPRDAVADVLKDAIVKAYVKERDEEMIEVAKILITRFLTLIKFSQLLKIMKI